MAKEHNDETNDIARFKKFVDAGGMVRRSAEDDTMVPNPVFLRVVPVVDKDNKRKISNDISAQLVRVAGYTDEGQPIVDTLNLGSITKNRLTELYATLKTMYPDLLVHESLEDAPFMVDESRKTKDPKVTKMLEAAMQNKKDLGVTEDDTAAVTALSNITADKDTADYYRTLINNGLLKSVTDLSSQLDDYMTQMANPELPRKMRDRAADQFNATMQGLRKRSAMLYKVLNDIDYKALATSGDILSAPLIENIEKFRSGDILKELDDMAEVVNKAYIQRREESPDSYIEDWTSKKGTAENKRDRIANKVAKLRTEIADIEHRREKANQNGDNTTYYRLSDRLEDKRTLLSNLTIDLDKANAELEKYDEATMQLNADAAAEKRRGEHTMSQEQIDEMYKQSEAATKRIQELTDRNSLYTNQLDDLWRQFENNPFKQVKDRHDALQRRAMELHEQLSLLDSSERMAKERIAELENTIIPSFNDKTLERAKQLNEIKVTNPDKYDDVHKQFMQNPIRDDEGLTVEDYMLELKRLQKYLTSTEPTFEETVIKGDPDKGIADEVTKRYVTGKSIAADTQYYNDLLDEVYADMDDIDAEVDANPELYDQAVKEYKELQNSYNALSQEYETFRPELNTIQELQKAINDYTNLKLNYSEDAAVLRAQQDEMNDLLYRDRLKRHMSDAETGMNDAHDVIMQHIGRVTNPERTKLFDSAVKKLPYDVNLVDELFNEFPPATYGSKTEKRSSGEALSAADIMNLFSGKSIVRNDGKEISGKAVRDAGIYYGGKPLVAADALNKYVLSYLNNRKYRDFLANTLDDLNTGKGIMPEYYRYSPRFNKLFGANGLVDVLSYLTNTERDGELYNYATPDVVNTIRQEYKNRADSYLGSADAKNVVLKDAIQTRAQREKADKFFRQIRSGYGDYDELKLGKYRAPSYSDAKRFITEQLEDFVNDAQKNPAFANVPLLQSDQNQLDNFSKEIKSYADEYFSTDPAMHKELYAIAKKASSLHRELSSKGDMLMGYDPLKDYGSPFRSSVDNTAWQNLSALADKLGMKPAELLKQYMTDEKVLAHKDTNVKDFFLDDTSDTGYRVGKIDRPFNYAEATDVAFEQAKDIYKQLYENELRSFNTINKAFNTEEGRPYVDEPSLPSWYLAQLLDDVDFDAVDLDDEDIPEELKTFYSDVMQGAYKDDDEELNNAFNHYMIDRIHRALLDDQDPDKMLAEGKLWINRPKKEKKEKKEKAKEPTVAERMDTLLQSKDYLAEADERREDKNERIQKQLDVQRGYAKNVADRIQDELMQLDSGEITVEDLLKPKSDSNDTEGSDKGFGTGYLLHYGADDRLKQINSGNLPLLSIISPNAAKAKDLHAAIAEIRQKELEAFITRTIKEYKAEGKQLSKKQAENLYRVWPGKMSNTAVRREAHKLLNNKQNPLAKSDALDSNTLKALKRAQYQMFANPNADISSNLTWSQEQKLHSTTPEVTKFELKAKPENAGVMTDTDWDNIAYNTKKDATMAKQAAERAKAEQNERTYQEELKKKEQAKNGDSQSNNGLLMNILQTAIMNNQPVGSKTAFTQEVKEADSAQDEAVKETKEAIEAQDKAAEETKEAVEAVAKPRKRVVRPKKVVRETKEAVTAQEKAAKETEEAIAAQEEAEDEADDVFDIGKYMLNNGDLYDTFK